MSADYVFQKCELHLNQLSKWIQTFLVKCRQIIIILQSLTGYSRWHFWCSWWYCLEWYTWSRFLLKWIKEDSLSLFSYDNDLCKQIIRPIGLIRKLEACGIKPGSTWVIMGSSAAKRHKKRKKCSTREIWTMPPVLLSPEALEMNECTDGRCDFIHKQVLVKFSHHWLLLITSHSHSFRSSHWMACELSNEICESSPVTQLHQFSIRWMNWMMHNALTYGRLQQYW